MVSSSLLQDHVINLQQSKPHLQQYKIWIVLLVCLLVLQPVADKAQLSSAIVTDTLAALPVSPQAISHVQGPILEVHQVGMRLKAFNIT